MTARMTSIFGNEMAGPDFDATLITELVDELLDLVELGVGQT